ncbi:hypothetical protein WAI453_000068 [Rhynchosporium graminicola]
MPDARGTMWPSPRSIQLPAKAEPQSTINSTSPWQPPISWGCNNSLAFESNTSVTASGGPRLLFAIRMRDTF